MRCFFHHSYTPIDEREGKPGIYITSSPLKPENCYFEVVILDPGEGGFITPNNISE